MSKAIIKSESFDNTYWNSQLGMWVIREEATVYTFMDICNKHYRVLLASDSQRDPEDRLRPVVEII